MLYAPQIQNNDCGFACLKMLLCHVHKDKNYLFLRQDKEKGDYSYQQLADIAEKEGLTLRGIQVDDKSSIRQHDNFPIIVSLNLPSGAKHSVVVKKVRFNRVYYIDPSYGHTSINISSFLELWDGTALVPMGNANFKCKDKGFDPISPFRRSLYYIGNILVGVLAILGVYFIKENTYIFIPIIFFLMAIIVEIVLKTYTFSLMKQADNVFFENAIVKKKDYFKVFRDYQNYKKNFFHSPLTLIINVLLALGLIAVTLLNDYMNVILILAPFLMISIDYLILNPYLQSEGFKIELLEGELSTSESRDDYASKVRGIHEKAYRLGKIFTFKRFAYLAAFIATAIILIAVTRVVSFPFAVFYFCIEFALYEVLSRITNYTKIQNELLKDKIKISNHIHLNDENNSH